MHDHVDCPPTSFTTYYPCITYPHAVLIFSIQLYYCAGSERRCFGFILSSVSPDSAVKLHLERGQKSRSHSIYTSGDVGQNKLLQFILGYIYILKHLQSNFIDKILFFGSS